MPQKSFWSAVLVAVICVALATPAKADSLETAGRNIVIGIVAVTAALAVVITVVIMHESRKDRTITGCVSSGADTMTITDQRDQRVYVLSGNTVGIVAGERMKLRGKRLKLQDAGKTPAWETTTVLKDFGVCHP